MKNSYLNSLPKKSPKKILADMQRKASRLDAQVRKYQAELKLVKLDIEAFQEIHPELKQPPIQIAKVRRSGFS